MTLVSKTETQLGSNRQTTGEGWRGWMGARAADPDRACAHKREMCGCEEAEIARMFAPVANALPVFKGREQLSSSTVF